jgi:hypothetical protein
MDVVYLVRADNHKPNIELKYSVRTLSQNYGKMKQLWMSGNKPGFFNSTVYEIRSKQGSFTKNVKIKYINARMNLERAVEHRDVSENFILMNDDFFITEPITEIPTCHMGTLEDFLLLYQSVLNRESRYMRAEVKTHQWLKDTFGINQTYSYSLHIPMVINKEKMRELLTIMPEDLAGFPIHIRTAYGNFAQVGGDRIDDPKVNGRTINLPRPFASCKDEIFYNTPFGSQIRNMFPKPSPYEVVLK